jgi:NAD(P)-dependent dehydrogenase (short-subunit alcohol dehydrogenase family)
MPCDATECEFFIPKGVSDLNDRGAVRIPLSENTKMLAGKDGLIVGVAKLAEPLIIDGGCLLEFTFHGAERVMPRCGVMGPVKAALETAVKYMAAELGAQKMRVNAISPGPVATRSASGLSHFDDLLDRAGKEAPEHRLITADDVGALASFLVSDDASAITIGQWTNARGWRCASRMSVSAAFVL